jgi:segregation and condensation protein B
MESMETSETIEPREAEAQETVAADELLPGVEMSPDAQATEDARLRALLEAVVYVTEEPLTLEQIAAGIAQPRERVEKVLDELVAEFEKPEHGVTIRLVAGGYKMATKPEHHESVRSFVKNLKPPLKLSLPALETLAVVAYKQPVTRSRVAAIRGVNCDGVIKTLVTRGLVEECGTETESGAHLYRTTKLFLEKVGINSVADLPPIAPFLPDNIDEMDLAQR